MFILNQILFNSVKQNHKKNMSGIILKSYFELVQSLKKKKRKLKYRYLINCVLNFYLQKNCPRFIVWKNMFFLYFYLISFFFLGFRQKLLFKSFGKIVTIVALSKYIIN